MTPKCTKKLIKQFDKTAEFYARIEKWQKENNTTACPLASWIGLECIAHSEGYEGITGTLFMDVETHVAIGVPSRGINIYMI